MGSVFAEADRNSAVLQEVEPNLNLRVVGAVDDGLIEISMQNGTIGYVDQSVFTPAPN